MTVQQFRDTMAVDKKVQDGKLRLILLKCAPTALAPAAALLAALFAAAAALCSVLCALPAVSCPACCCRCCCQLRLTPPSTLSLPHRLAAVALCLPCLPSQGPPGQLRDYGRL